MSSLEALQAEVAANTQVTASAVALITGLGNKLTEAIAAQKAGDNGAALDALNTDLTASTTMLAAAVAANTPAVAADPAAGGAAPAA